MASTRSVLDGIAQNLEESMGVRDVAGVKPTLSPVPRSKDVGRRPVRHIGSIDINQVIPDPEQPRVQFSEEQIANLSKSIQDHGQFHPIIVRWDEALSKWIIISGERRYRAAKQAGLAAIDCFFKEGEFSRAELLSQQIIENSLREDLQPIEQAKAFSRLMELNGWTGKAVAEALHIQPSTVSRTLALLTLPESVQEQVAAGELAPRKAYEISKLGNDEAKSRLAEEAAEKSLSTEQTKRAVSKRAGKKKPKPRSTKETIRTPEGWTVTVSSRKKGSYHEVEQALEYALDEIRHRIKNGIQAI